MESDASASTTTKIAANGASSIGGSMIGLIKHTFATGTTWGEKFYNSLAVAAFGTSFAAYAIEQSLLVGGLGALCSFLGTAAAVKEEKIQEMQGLRTVINESREEVNKLRTLNATLMENNRQLQKTCHKLEQCQFALNELTKNQITSVDMLVKQVNELKSIQSKMKRNVQAEIIQNVLTIVLSSDIDSDNIIDPEEVNGLIVRIKFMEGFELNEVNFRKKLDKKGGCSLTAVFNIIKNLMDDKVPNEDNIFVIKPEEIHQKSKAKTK
mmetsp:Transcript_25688/g.37875  ORF Transcript_25688/g.37875 Transcript_25688/m.37875 type:complete len:267 (+) Transcript_25688:110-910(+)|eukprot:CAMPEP_0195519478 /NCGR_PEP_ID=MMETSP0794_2-20130614/14855_1 /TAXON_ID=515487 /ORGANISM="Stephanopyxis turris, Strain CCMP 815" /LENGTH=266 /DNA_ID=CAMNT_0040648635 /DNA_START=94 /DNA_END=897 /DNA_ORIENTATION=+